MTNAKSREYSPTIEQWYTEGYARICARGHSIACAKGYSKAYAERYINSYCQGYKAGLEEGAISTLWSLVQEAYITLEEAADVLQMTTQVFLERVKEICGIDPQ